MKRLLITVASVGSMLLAAPAQAGHRVKAEKHQTVVTGTREVQPGSDVRTGMDTDQDSTRIRTDADLKAAASNVGDQAKTAAGNAAGDVSAATEKAGDKIASAGDELAGREGAHEKGMVNHGAVRNTLTTNPLGLFSGEGLNLMYAHPFARKISGVAGANYSRTNAGDGAVTEYGVTVGGDYFLLGQNNEGLRVGPRVQLAGGSSSVGRNTLVGEVSLAGELGYNWIANNGITAGAGAGLAGRLGGALDTQADNQNDSAGRGRVNPYGRLNIGYSW